MERDFMGLSSKEPLAEVKEEVAIVSEGFKDMGFHKGSAVQWPFTNRVSAFSYPNSFKFAQENKTRIGSDSMASPGFMSLSASDAHAASHRRSVPEIETKKLFNQERNNGSPFPLNAYPMQQGHSMHRPHDAKMFPVSNHAMSVSMGNPFFKNHYATPGQNMTCTAVKPQPLGGVPVTMPHSIIPTVGSVAGMTESCTKASRSFPQLTIFYAGTVNVFDDISPEKAQAIMFLGGKGATRPSNVTQPKVQPPSPSSKPAAADVSPMNQSPSSKPAAADVSPMNQSATTPRCSRLSSPLSVSSHTGDQSGSGSTNTTEEIMAAKTSGAATTHVSKPEPQKAASMLPPASAIPQARKASLARFLEKRKERVMSAAPYTSFSQKSPELGTLGSK